ncbi:hypothetical protein ACWGMA_20570 [Streptomyces asiaticus]
MKSNPWSLPNDRRSCLAISVAVGVIVFGLVVLFALLVTDLDDDRGCTGRCTPGFAGIVDPVTCLPYGSAGPAAPLTNHSGNSAQKQPKAPAANASAVPKAPPVRLTK